MFCVVLVETVNYYQQYTRDEVIDLMSLSQGRVSADLRQEYESLSDDELEVAFLQELRLGSNETVDAVTEDSQRHSDVISTEFFVEQEAARQ